MASIKALAPPCGQRGRGGNGGALLYQLQDPGRPGSTLGAKKGSLKMYSGASTRLWVTDSALQEPSQVQSQHWVVSLLPLLQAPHSSREGEERTTRLRLHSARPAQPARKHWTVPSPCSQPPQEHAHREPRAKAATSG